MPKHWEIKRLKYIASTNDDVMAENEDPLREILYVDIGSISPSKGITTTEEMVIEDAPTRARRLGDMATRSFQPLEHTSVRSHQSTIPHLKWLYPPALPSSGHET